jgi:tetratricopeptide (TPR) repeat protein
LYRADCAYDLADYGTAIKLYEQAATRFATSVTAAEAYVQVINAHLAMKEVGQARAAAERGRWILQKIPDDQFGKGPLALSRQYYEGILRVGSGP